MTLYFAGFEDSVSTSFPFNVFEIVVWLRHASNSSLMLEAESLVTYGVILGDSVTSFSFDFFEIVSWCIREFISSLILVEAEKKPSDQCQSLLQNLRMCPLSLSTYQSE